VIPLRPISMGEILDGSIATIRRNPKATLGFTAVVMVASTAITTFLAARGLPGLARISAHPGQKLTSADVTSLGGWLVTYGLVSLLLGLAVTVILTGTLTAVVGRAVLGQHITAGEALRQARIGTLARLVLLLVGIFVLVWAVLIGVPLLGTVASRPVGVALALVALIAAVPLTIFLWVKTSLAASAVVLERATVTGAIARSWRLTSRSFWRVFGIWVMSYFAVFVAGLVLEVPFRIIAGVIAGTGGLGLSAPPALAGGKLVLYLTISAVGSLVAATVTRPMVAGVAALLYVDLRMRREGLDLTLQAAAGQPPEHVWRPPTADR